MCSFSYEETHLRGRKSPNPGRASWRHAGGAVRRKWGSLTARQAAEFVQAAGNVGTAPIHLLESGCEVVRHWRQRSHAGDSQVSSYPRADATRSRWQRGSAVSSDDFDGRITPVSPRLLGDDGISRLLEEIVERISAPAMV